MTNEYIIYIKVRKGMKNSTHNLCESSDGRSYTHTGGQTEKIECSAHDRFAPERRPNAGGNARQVEQFAANHPIIPSCESIKRTTVWPSYSHLTFSIPLHRVRSDSPSSGGLEQKENDQDGEMASAQKQRLDIIEVRSRIPATIDLTPVVYL